MKKQKRQMKSKQIISLIRVTQMKKKRLAKNITTEAVQVEVLSDRNHHLGVLKNKKSDSTIMLTPVSYTHLDVYKRQM